VSTNFYWYPPANDPTSEVIEGIHIGKRVGAGGGLIGFMFQGVDDADARIDSWERWKNTLLHGGGTIHDEYGSQMPLAEFIDMVENVTPENRRRQYDWVQENKDLPSHSFFKFDDWLCPDGFSFTYREFC
jgi:hypothetical protein